MINTTITYMQLFGIGFGIGLAGPCLLTCAPVIVTYVAAKQENWRRSLIDIVIFLFGRLFAYIFLGYLAGLSGAILQKVSSSWLMPFIKASGGLIIIALGVFVLFEKEPFSFACKFRSNKIFNAGNLFILGIIMGIVPCGPLLALLLEITLISKSAADGMLYALFFGLGTLISGFISIAALSGVFAWLPAKAIKSKTGGLIFRAICALLLVWLGFNLIFRWIT